LIYAGPPGFLQALAEAAAPGGRVFVRGLALLLLMLGILADDHHAALALDDLALLANGFYRRPDFHRNFLLVSS
jgi:hypothetical protein